LIQTREKLAFVLDEEVFNDLTEAEMRQHLNEIALSSEEQKRIKDDVKNLLDKQLA
jgi:hypothetical protein